MKFLLITADPAVAAFAIDCGVDRIFVDLEVHGKKQRQGHLDTVMSAHSQRDIEKVRRVVPDGRLLVRINPIHDGTAAEVEAVVAAGADEIMLPMFRSVDELEFLEGCIKGRVRIIPLLETAAALVRIPWLLGVESVREYFIGLNDLHLAMKLQFMFEPLAGGLIDHAASLFKRASRPFGFGGIARADQGDLSGEMVMKEHARLGSSSVILSRSFHKRSQTLDELRVNIDLSSELLRLRSVEQRALSRSPSEIERDRLAVQATVWRCAARAAKPAFSPCP